VLSRIERFTRNKLRAEIEPLTHQQFYRFLLRWHGLSPGERLGGREGLARVLSMLDGVEIPAGVWEPQILSARVDRYDLHDLDELCLSGRFGWGRVSMPATTDAKPGLTTATPVALFDTENLGLWRSLANRSGDGQRLTEPARRLLAAFGERGPSFMTQIERSLGMLRTQYEDALSELVAAGRVASDSFAGLRALLVKPSRLRVSRLDVIANSNSGRWSLLPQPDPLDDPVEYDGVVQRYAHALLRRYGVVVRAIVQRENATIAWTDLLRVLRRMEARGEVRGGYFVDGAGGEHFALPEALPALHGARLADDTGGLVALSAADPLNMTGILTEGPRVPSRATTRILLQDAIPIAIAERDRVKALPGRGTLPDGGVQALRAPTARGALAVYY
jgi:ATP-dependent Lhr-like helicase